MDRPRLIRGLRIAWTAFFGVLCVLLAVLWVRSYKELVLLGDYRTQTGEYEVSSYDGNIWVIEIIDSPIVSRFSSGKLHRLVLRPLPLWFFTLVALASSVSPWFRWRYSLRTLLIATTLIAVGLGFFVWATK